MPGVIDFSIRISQQISGDDAVGKLQKLEKQIARETNVIGAMESKLVSAKKRLTELMNGSGGNSASIAAVDKMRASIAQLEGDLAKKKGGLGSLLGGLDGAKSGAGAQTAMAEMVAMSGPILAVAAAVMVLVTALAATAFALTSFALGAANAHRSTLLLMGALTGSTQAATENVAAIERVADSTALAKSQVEDIGKRLAIAGIDGQRFETTLGAISTATALLGESAGSHLEGIIEKSKALGHFQFSDRQLKGLGLSFADLAAQLNMTGPAFKAAMKAGQVSVEQGVDAINAAITTRFGAGSAGMMLDFNVQMMKAKEHLTALFKDINIEPFLKAMHDLLSLFDQSTDSGKAMHLILTKGFDALFAVIAKVEPFAKAFFQGVLIGALLIYIGVMKIKKALDDAFGGDTASSIDGITVAMYAGIAVMTIMTGIVLALTVAVVILAAAMLLPFAPVIVILAVMYGMFVLLEGAVDRVSDAFRAILLPDLAGSGTSMVDGLVNAVLGGQDRFAAAMKALGQAGMDGLNSIFHFGSPSKAMYQRGEWIDEGGAQGVEAQGAMSRAMGGMAKPSDARGSDGGKGAPQGPVYVTIDARGADKGMVDYMMAKLGDVFEGAAIIVGAAPEPEPSA